MAGLEFVEFCASIENVQVKESDMSLDYAEKRIKEALKLAKGNIVRARQQIIAWTYEDSKLLHELAKPHLTGIVAYHVDRVKSGRASKPVQPPPAKPQPSQTKGQNEEQFGLEIIKAIAASEGATFGLEGDAVQRRPGQASQQHINAMKVIASKSKTTE